MQDEDLKGKILWCSRQKKGIKLKKPNDNLCDAYLKKSANSLKSMNLNMGSHLYEWAVDAAYYARYQAIYALLQKCGIVSEIHDCSIASMRFLFKSELAEKLFAELETAKKQRIDLVYYTNRLVAEKDIKKNIRAAPHFVLTIEKLVSEITIDRVNELRGVLKKILAP